MSINFRNNIYTFFFIFFTHDGNKKLEIKQESKEKEKAVLLIKKRSQDICV